MRQVVGILRPAISVNACGVKIDVGGGEQFGLAVGRDPLARAVMMAVGLAHPVQHQLVAGARCSDNQSHPVWSDASGWLLHSRSSQACPVTSAGVSSMVRRPFTR